MTQQPKHHPAKRPLLGTARRTLRRLLALALAPLALNSALATTALATTAPATAAAAPSDAGTFFDDFNYADLSALRKSGWIVRDKPGLPGVAGATWGGAVSLLDAPSQPGNRILRLPASTDGTPANTVHSQVCHHRKYFEGTYATRIRLTDTPVSGPDGDNVIQAFYLVSPLKHAFDPQFSEVDWEYLPNGGWGDPKTRLYSTTWQTVRLDPWQAFNQMHQEFRALDGWRTLLMQVSDGKTRYYLDGVFLDQHGGRNTPVVPMSLNFNTWFAEGGFLPDSKIPRTYLQDVDWVFHARNRVLSPAEVDTAIAALRKAGPGQTDTVPQNSPPLASTCDL